MTDSQASRVGEKDRSSWAKASLRSSRGVIPDRWYAVNTRESIRDDTIRSGLIANGAVVEREGLATTSPAPRYALVSSFAHLFDPDCDEEELQGMVASWQAENLTAGALARITLVRKGAAAGGDYVLVRFPSGETRRMAPGPSSIISKAFVEIFVPRFLNVPAVVFLSESRRKIVRRDDELAKSIGLEITAQKDLPDVVVADLASSDPTIVFGEMVATDGPVTTERKQSLIRLALNAGFTPERVAFVTAFLDRNDMAFRKTLRSIAWGTFVWFVSEPNHLIHLYEGSADVETNLSEWPQ